MPNNAIPMRVITPPTSIPMLADAYRVIEAVSPTVTTEQITGGWKITITDVDGPHVITLYNGADGRGIASTALNADYTLTITYTDGNSYTTPSIRGERGAGITSIAYTSTSGLVDTYTITYGDGQTATFTVTNGAPGTPGTSAYVWIRYASAQPTQDSDISTTPGPWMGVYSGSSAAAPTHYTDYTWNKVEGPSGEIVTVTVSGSTPSITAANNTLYQCGEVSTLTITPPASGIFGVTFTSGSTATVLTATGITWPAWFDATSLDTNTIYEINVCNGLAMVATWEVSAS